ncbi:6-phospho-3-hexuloisomerase [Actinomycetales bacterium JB111]|nr:6-phospho-3-hexuloisomerase [Actinomycetales bacterium JB111]
MTSAAPSESPAPRRLAAEIDRVLAAVSPAEYSAARDLLGARSGATFVLGQGRSGLVARMAAMRFMHLGRAAHAVGESTAPAIGEADLLVAISSSGTTPGTMAAARIAASLGAEVLAVTASEDSPLAELGSRTLLVPAGDSEQFGNSLFEQSALLLLDALVLDLSGGDEATYREMAARHTNLE